MNRNKVIIVKQKWDEDSHYSKVKRVFFSEENAMEYINEQKELEINNGCHWILSDREISDYTPCLSDKDLNIYALEAKQELIEQMIQDNNEGMDSYTLELYWSKLEEELLNIKWDDE